MIKDIVTFEKGKIIVKITNAWHHTYTPKELQESIINLQILKDQIINILNPEKAKKDWDIQPLNYDLIRSVLIKEKYDSKFLDEIFKDVIPKK